ncbi:MAG: flavin reductase family protein [Elusimicrobia bacterium]|nr:flavin reductase family protein [Elusimicrobiota bacterium]
MDKALSKLSYGLYIVSSREGEKFNGQIVNSVFQVTAEPPKVAVSLHKNNLTHSYVEKSRVFSVSVLDQNAPMTCIGLFGFKCGREIDKFAKISHKVSDGCPMVTENALSVFACKVVSSLDIGTHTLFIGEVYDAETLKDGTPLTYDYYRNAKKGKTQKNATTYTAPPKGT